MKSEAGWNRAHAGGRASAILLLLTAALWGCGAERIQHAVSLHYEGTDAPRLFEPSQAPTIIVAPFQDRRVGKENLGVYQWQRLTVELTPKGGTASAGVTEMARAFVERMGLKSASGDWDGEVASLPGIEGDYALYGEIIALKFTGEGGLPDAKNRGTVSISIRLGSRASRTVVRRDVEVTPDESRFILFDNRYEHIGQMERIIRRSVSRAIRDGLTDLVRRANAGTPGQTRQAPSSGEPNPFERFQRR